MARSSLWTAVAAIGTLLGGVAAIGLLVMQQHSATPKPEAPKEPLQVAMSSVASVVPVISDARSAKVEEKPPKVEAASTGKFPNSAATTKFCALIAAAAAEAPSNFEKWKGGPALQQKDGSTFWSSPHMLPGANDCAVSKMPNYSEQAYVCFWNTETEEDAAIARADVTRSLRDCPNMTRGVNGHPSLGRVQFYVRPLARPNVIAMDVVDTTNLNADVQASAGIEKAP